MARIIIGTAVCAFIGIRLILSGTLYSYGSGRDLIENVGGALTRIQLVPVLLSASAGVTISIVVIIILAVTAILFGRVYCAALCPLGVIQDIAFRIGSVYRKRKLLFMRGERIIWYTVCALLIGSVLAGFASVAGWIDPYSLFGKGIVYTVRPALISIYNTYIIPLIQTDSVYIQNIRNSTFHFPYIIIGAGLFAGLFIITALKGRVWCNYICPVGAGLGLISKIAPFKMRIGDSCTSCGLCERKCRGGCISIKDKEIDDDRCVRCFDCVADCPSGSVYFGVMGKSESSVNNISPVSRKDFLRKGLLSGTAVGAGVLLPNVVRGAIGSVSGNYPFPPGGMDETRFSKLCTSCGLCTAKCTSGVIRPALFEKGLSGFMQPLLDFEKGFCVYECALCSEVCPSGALRKLTHTEKRTLSIGHAVFEKKKCIVVKDNTSCGACAEVCPTHALTMIPYGKKLMIPVVDTSICIGCGACVFQCPSRPDRALFVNKLETQVPIEKKIRKGSSAQIGESGKKAEAKEDFPF
jgi:ferredoxin